MPKPHEWLEKGGIVVRTSMRGRLTVSRAVALAVAFTLGVSTAQSQVLDALADEVTVTILTTNTADGNGA
jgi:hypothetical protein